jgi:ubiquinone/menaquinone biosynthesis C-methylase UbiE
MPAQLKAKTREEIAAAYSSPPWWYDVRGFFILTFAYRGTVWGQVAFFAPNFGPRHLEVAIGTGTLCEMVLRWRRLKHLPEARVVGIDYAESMLAGAIKRFRNDLAIELHHADVTSMSFPDATFDTANIANSIHCFPDVDAALRETYRVLKPGGTLAANVLLYPRGPQPFCWIASRINDWGMRKGILVTPYEPDDVRRRLTAVGFQILSEEVAGNAYNVRARKPIA